MPKALLPVLLCVTLVAAAWWHFDQQALVPGVSQAGGAAPGKPGQPAAAVPSPSADALAAIAAARAVIIEQKTTALIGTPRSVELISEQAEAAHAAIEARDFATARRITDDVLAHSQLQSWSFAPFNDFMSNVVVPGGAEFERGLDAWVAAAPDYSLPLVIRAFHLYAQAWRVRGEHFASKTRDEHMQAFAQGIARASADVETALGLDKHLPWLHYQKLDILAGHGNSEAMQQAFLDGIALYPAYYPLYTMRMRTLEPKWGGSVKALIEFVDTYGAKLDEKSPLQFLYLELYRQLIDVAATACVSNEAAARQSCTEDRLSKLLPPHIDAHLATAIAVHRHSDAYQYGTALSSVLESMVKYSAAKKYIDPVVQMAADALGTENQLMEEHPGHNNYRLDAITANIWLREGRKDNAETKLQEAVRDLANARFPGEREHAVALATLYASLAGVYRELSQFEDSIAYQRAAESLGGPPFKRSTVICYAYYRLKDYQSAYRECDAVYKRSLDYEALYWRARMEHELKDGDAAIRDFTTIADSEHGRATSAVIDLSVLYGERRDPRAQLAVFEKYPYVFDEDSRDEGDLAIVYNNRCYAYKELGQLDKALADCNTSLKFGDIPDARQKKQDIEKRLKAHETGA